MAQDPSPERCAFFTPHVLLAETISNHLLRCLASGGLASCKEACQGFLRQVIAMDGNGRRDDLFEFVIAFTV